MRPILIIPHGSIDQPDYGKLEFEGYLVVQMRHIEAPLLLEAATKAPTSLQVNVTPNA